jgi:hypothetical protein
MTYAERTEVSSDKSRTEIERTLRRYGATEFQYGWNASEARVGFEIADRRVLFRLPMPDANADEFVLTPTGRERSRPAAEQEYERAVRQRWRALTLVIKAKLEAVEAQITTVEQEFLAHILMPDGTTVGEQVAPRIAVAYNTGLTLELMPS